MFVNERMKITIKIMCRYIQNRNVLIITTTNIYIT